MEHSSGDKSERRNPISYIKSKTSKPKVAFGAKLRASFLASPDSANGTDIGVRESTASIVFDTLEMRSGTYWTIHSIGDYEEALALKWLDQAKQGTYTSPQEVFLDKLGRWACQLLSSDHAADVHSTDHRLCSRQRNVSSIEDARI